MPGSRNSVGAPRRCGAPRRPFPSVWCPTPVRPRVARSCLSPTCFSSDKEESLMRKVRSIERRKWMSGISEDGVGGIADCSTRPIPPTPSFQFIFTYLHFALLGPRAGDGGGWVFGLCRPEAEPKGPTRTARRRSLGFARDDTTLYPTRPRQRANRPPAGLVQGPERNYSRVRGRSPGENPTAGPGESPLTLALRFEVCRSCAP